MSGEGFFLLLPHASNITRAAATGSSSPTQCTLLLAVCRVPPDVTHVLKLALPALAIVSYHLSPTTPNPACLILPGAWY